MGLQGTAMQMRGLAGDLVQATRTGACTMAKLAAKVPQGRPRLTGASAQPSKVSTPVYDVPGLYSHRGARSGAAGRSNRWHSRSAARSSTRKLQRACSPSYSCIPVLRPQTRSPTLLHRMRVPLHSRTTTQQPTLPPPLCRTRTHPVPHAARRPPLTRNLPPRAVATQSARCIIPQVSTSRASPRAA